MGKDSKKRRERRQARGSHPPRPQSLNSTQVQKPANPPGSPATTAALPTPAPQSASQPQASSAPSPGSEVKTTRPRPEFADRFAAKIFEIYIEYNSAAEVAGHTPEETLELCCQRLWEHPDRSKRNGERAGLRAYKCLCETLCPGSKTERQKQWLVWLSGVEQLPLAEYAKFTPPTTIRAAYPDYYKDAAGVYGWARSVGLDPREWKRLWDIVVRLRVEKQGAYTLTFWTAEDEERTARARVEAGKVLLDLIPNPQKDDYDDYDDVDDVDDDKEIDDFEDYDEVTETICASYGGRIVAMFDRAHNMSWETALSALIRDGFITLTPEQEKLSQTGARLWGHPSWFVLRRARKSELRQWTTAGNSILKAARAKAGQGKTSRFKADRIRSLAEALGLGTIEIPASSMEATRLEQSLSVEYQSRKLKGTLPPTERQVAFAKELASRCNTVVPAEALVSFRACSEFIERSKELAPPSEQQVQYARRLAGNIPIPEEALVSTKACSEWIEKISHANIQANVEAARRRSTQPQVK